MLVDVLRQAVHPVGRAAATPAHPHRREALPVSGVQQEVHAQRPPLQAHPDAQQAEKGPRAVPARGRFVVLGLGLLGFLLFSRVVESRCFKLNFFLYFFLCSIARVSKLPCLTCVVLATIQLGDSMKSGGLSDEGEEDDMDMDEEDLKPEEEDDEDSDPVPLGQLAKPKLEPGMPQRPAAMAVTTLSSPNSAMGLMMAGGPGGATAGTVQPVAVSNGSSTGIVWIASGSLLGLQQPQPPPPPPPLYSIKQLNNSQVVI